MAEKLEMAGKFRKWQKNQKKAGNEEKAGNFENALELNHGEYSKAFQELFTIILKVGVIGSW